MSGQIKFGLILILIGTIISLIGFFIITPTKDFLTAVLITAVGFILIAIGGGILKSRFRNWVNRN